MHTNRAHLESKGLRDAEIFVVAAHRRVPRLCGRPRAREVTSRGKGHRPRCGDRAGPRQRLNGDTTLLRFLDKLKARVGDAGCARV